MLYEVITMDETRRAEIAQERAMEELEAEVLRREAAQGVTSRPKKIV